MDNTNMFLIMVGLVLMTLILTVGFGQCEQTGGMEVYKICMQHAKDTTQCKDPFSEKK